MSNPVYYMQECPTCGRNLRVRVAYLGKRVVCQHCKSQFKAFDESTGEAPPEDSGTSVLDRADKLLASVDAMKSREN